MSPGWNNIIVIAEMAIISLVARRYYRKVSKVTLKEDLKDVTRTADDSTLPHNEATPTSRFADQRSCAFYYSPDSFYERSRDDPARGSSYERIRHTRRLPSPSLLTGLRDDHVTPDHVVRNNIHDVIAVNNCTLTFTTV